MAMYKKLKPNLYSADLHYGKIDLCDLKPGHGFSCFFIVQNTDDRDFIKDQAIQLLLAGCRNFDFYGKMEPIWHLGFDDADIMLNPNSTPETVALTSGWSTIDEFTEVLHNEISCRTFVPHDFYLIYDDKKIYEDVLRRLESL